MISTIFHSIHSKILSVISIKNSKILIYNCRRIFFILSVFVLYILSFGLVRLRTFRLSEWVSLVHTLGRRFWNSKKVSLLRFDARGKKLIFGARWGQTSSLRRGAARGGVRWKRQHSKKLCLSLLISKNLKHKKVNKSFVPEPISCFSGFRMYISHICILVLFWIFWWTYMLQYCSKWKLEFKLNLFSIQ